MRKFKAQGVYKAYTNSDTTEGRGYEIVIGYFVHEADARKAVKGQGVMGTDAWVSKTDIECKVFESFDEFEAEGNENLRKQALSKLTRDEIKALGLDINGRK